MRPTDELGRVVISDCWAAYSSLSDEEYTNVPVNHSITFVVETIGAHTNTIQSMWKQVKALLTPYNRKAESVDPFCKFIQIVANIDWSTIDSTDSQWHYVRMCVCVQCATNDFSLLPN